MPIVLDGSGSITGLSAGGLPDNSVTSAEIASGAVTVSKIDTTVSQLFGMRNRIINGAMEIDQRNAGASVTASVAGTVTYTLDRWAYFASAASKFTVQQNAGSVTPPVGFTNYLGVTSLSAYSVGASELFVINQRIEGYNIADLAWGTANAQSVTLSFWVRSSLTGTFTVAFRNSAVDRSYIAPYTINTANTWEKKSVTIAGDTSGTWLTTNGIGVRLDWSLGSGSDYQGTADAWTATNDITTSGATSVVGTNGATFYITGVQLEVGSTATPFERRLYNQELANCQRYYITVGGDTSTQTLTMMQVFSTTGFNGGTVPFPVKMRTIPTFSYSALSDFYVQTSAGGAAVPTTITQSANEASTMCGAIKGTVSSGLTAGNASSFLASSINARLNFSAEL